VSGTLPTADILVRVSGFGDTDVPYRILPDKDVRKSAEEAE
jgi:hypothetical protein